MSAALRVARAIARHGRLVTVQLAPATLGGAWTNVVVAGHVMGFDARQIVAGGTVQQGDRELRIASAAWSGARLPRQGDRVVMEGRTAAILSVETRMAQAAPAMLVLQLRGA